MENRPADVLIPHFAGGRPLALDIIVVSPLQIQFVDRAGESPGIALEQRHRQKCLKYTEACMTEGIVFQPLVVETLGGWDKGAEATIARVGKAMALESGQTANEVVRHLFGRLSVLLMRGKSCLLLSRTPTHTNAILNGVS